MEYCGVNKCMCIDLISGSVLSVPFKFLIEIIDFSWTIEICENQEFLKNQEKWHLCSIVGAGPYRSEDNGVGVLHGQTGGHPVHTVLVHAVRH